MEVWVFPTPGFTCDVWVLYNSMSDENIVSKLCKGGLCVKCGHHYLHLADPAAPPPRSSCQVGQRGPWFEAGRPSPQLACPSQAGGRDSPAPPASCLKGCLDMDKNTLLYNPASEWYTLCIVQCVMTEQRSLLFKYLQRHKKVETPYFKLFNVAACICFYLILLCCFVGQRAHTHTHVYMYTSSVWKIWDTQLQMI